MTTTYTPTSDELHAWNEAQEEKAIHYTMAVLRSARDWQDAQFALYNHPEFGPWLEEHDPDCEASGCTMHIIREAEERLGDDLPY